MNLHKRILAAALAAGISVTAFGMTTFALGTSEIEFDRNTVYIDEGDTEGLSQYLDRGVNVKSTDIDWDVNGTAVSVSDSGVVRGLRAGEATVYAHAPSDSDSINVVVYDADDWDNRDDWDDDDWDRYWNDYYGYYYDERYERGDDYYDPYLDEWITGYRYGSGYFDEYGIDRRRDDYELARREAMGNRTPSRAATTSRQNRSQDLLAEIEFNRNVSLTKTADQNTVVNAAASSGAARLDNYASVSVNTLHAAANASSGVINFDTRSGGGLLGRLQITPSKAASLTSGDIKLGVHYKDSKTKTLSTRFNESYSNNVHVVMCDQGNYGMTVRLYVLLDANVDASSLVFYTYNAASNSLSKLDATGVSIDANGYVSFNTTYGGTILISEGGELRA